MDEFPAISEFADSKIEHFISNPSCRVKLATPDLGELLILLLISKKFTWRQIATCFLQEFYDRLVLWMLGEN